MTENAKVKLGFLNIFTKTNILDNAKVTEIIQLD